MPWICGRIGISFVFIDFHSNFCGVLRHGLAKIVAKLGCLLSEVVPQKFCVLFLVGSAFWSKIRFLVSLVCIALYCIYDRRMDPPELFIVCRSTRRHKKPLVSEWVSKGVHELVS